MIADAIHIEKLTQTKGGGIDVSFQLLDEKGEGIGRYGMSWQTAEELDAFLEQATLNELIRAALRGVYDPALKELDTVALESKTLDMKALIAEKAIEAIP